MNTCTLPSSFADTETTIYHYPAAQESLQAAFVLKGLYGGHDPAGHSWDNELIPLLQPDYHVILVRTGRLEVEDKKAQFERKTFQQECQDFEHAFEYCRENVLEKDTLIHGIAMSFGGTTLLGLSPVLHSMNTVMFIGSGCGRNPETTKPLLSTLPETEILLESIKKFTGSFVFLHGGKDAVVPLESQRKIFDAADNASVRAWIEYLALGHELDDESGSYLAQLANTHFRHFT